jgi:hypothetical protein
MTQLVRWPFVAAVLLAGAIPAQAGPCDITQLAVNLEWAYNNNGNARKLIQEGVLTGGVAGAKQIAAGYRTGQSHNSDALKHLNSCGPIELLQTAKKLTGV